MRYIINAFTISEYGNRKDANGNPHQEDSIYPDAKNISPSDRLFILCDGMGGHAAGEVASATVCEAMAKYIGKLNPEGSFSENDFNRALDAAYDALDLKDSNDEKKMGTTMTMLKLHNMGVTIAHIGDSRVYQFRPGPDKDSTSIIFRTEDHSLVNDLIKVGELTPEQARTSKQKNIITRAMQPGGERRCKADLHQSADIRPGDWFYLCSDGMLEQADDDNLRFIFSNAAFQTPEQKVDALIENSKFNDDNHSAILVQIVDVIDPLPIPQKIGGPEVLEAIVEEEIPATMNMATSQSQMTSGIAPNQMRHVNSAANSLKKKKNNSSLIIIFFIVTALIAAIALFFFTDVFKDKKTDETIIERTEQEETKTDYDPQIIEAPVSSKSEAVTNNVNADSKHSNNGKANSKPVNNGKPQTTAQQDNSSANSAPNAAKISASNGGASGSDAADAVRKREATGNTTTGASNSTPATTGPKKGDN